MHDEYVVAGVHAHSDHVAEDPVIRERLGPHRIHLERRNGDGADARASVERPLAREKRGDRRDERRSANDGAAVHGLPPAAGQSTALPVALTGPIPRNVNFCTRLPS